MSYHATIFDSNFAAVDCEFFNSKLLLQENSQGVFHRCAFKGLWAGDDKKTLPMGSIGVCGGAHVTITESKLTKCYAPIQASDSMTNVIMRSCEILDCRFGILVGSNARANVSDCVLGAIITTWLYFKGEAEFCRNTTGPQRSTLGPPVIYLDSKTKLPKNDFENPLLFPMEQRVPQTPSKEQSKRSKEVYKQMEACMAASSNGQPLSYESVFGDGGMTTQFMVGCKMCRGCGAYEDRYGFDMDSPKSGEKFRYCSRCRKVCYCSKKCQDDDWMSHKLECER